jgi:Ohr subfamily peroxiredoxin
LDVTLGNPLEKGIEKRGPNPELLFAGAYSACYHSALIGNAKKLGTPVKDSTVRALVSLIEDDQGGYRLGVELHAQLPGIDRAQAQRIMDEAHKTCPYSKALRGATSVKLVVD